MDNFDKPLNYLYGMFLILIIAFIYFLDYRKIGPSAFKETYEKKEFKGIVRSKFIDEHNHNYKTFQLVNDLNKNILLNNDEDIFNYLQEGDSIFKPLNSTKFNIIRDNQQKQFELTFGCKE